MEEAMSPFDSIFFAPGFEYSIIAIVGVKTKIDPEVIKLGLQKNLLQHPRFTSIVVMDDDKGSKMRWKQVEINLDDHVMVPNLDPNMDNPDLFVDNYISDLTTSHYKDLSKPLWEFHLLDVKTSQATSTIVFKIHHSLGDGASLISLLLACTRKSSDPTVLASIPKRKIKLVGSPESDGLFKQDTKTPLKGGNQVSKNPKRFVHRTISLDDLKLVKKAMNMNVTINDVALGIARAGLSRYLARKYNNEEPNKNLPRIRLRGAITFNVRPTTGIEWGNADMMDKLSKVKWGNAGLGFVLLPFKISLEDDPLNYVRQAKAGIDRKKHSLEALCTFSCNVAVLKLFGSKVAGYLGHKIMFNTTFLMSNVVGPQEEISFFGHPVAYIAPSIFGIPQAFTLHLQSYVNKMAIVLAADQSVIPDPHELCNDFVEAFNLIKDAALKN